MIGTSFPFKMQKKIKKTKVVIVVGPTASGKSDLAVSIAKKFKGEIISADSRQVYRGMDIGTGKITKGEMKGIKHHLLDVADPRKRFNAEEYRILARKAIDKIISRGKLPIICGGTGFYIEALLNESLLSDVPPNLKLRKKLSKKSPAQLLLILKKLDPKRAATIEKSDSERNNQRRIIRAIEVAYKGSPWIKIVQGRTLYKPSRTRVALVQTKGSPCINRYDTIYIGIKPSSRDELRKRILVRLLRRLRHGMIDEGRRLHGKGLSWHRMDELGLEYRYLAKYLQEKMTGEEMIERLNTEIWHYARRQMTWFKRNKKIKWFGPADKKKIAERVGDFLEK
jgi:tRNA dimethylallyltransferase